MRIVTDRRDAIVIVFTTNTQPPAWLDHWAAAAGFRVPEPIRPDALPRVLRSGARLVLMHVHPSAPLLGPIELLAQLHRRRPQLVLVAVSEVADQTCERALRAAGADVFLVARNEQELADALSATHLMPAATRERSPPPPPARAPARAPVRARTRDRPAAPSDSRTTTNDPIDELAEEQP
jgi:hypothetical protein